MNCIKSQTWTINIHCYYLQTLLSYSEEAAVNALCGAITRHIEAANNPQSPNCVTRDVATIWKIYEACIVSLNTAKDSIIEQQQSGKLQFDIIRFLDSVVLATLNNPGKIHIISIEIKQKKNIFFVSEC